jgi:hypothetical protein
MRLCDSPPSLSQPEAVALVEVVSVCVWCAVQGGPGAFPQREAACGGGHARDGASSERGIRGGGQTCTLLIVVVWRVTRRDADVSSVRHTPVPLGLAWL